MDGEYVLLFEVVGTFWLGREVARFLAGGWGDLV